MFLPLDCFCFFIKNQLATLIWGHFWVLQFIQLIYVAIPPPIPHSFDYCIFLVRLEAKQYDSSNLVLFQNCFDHSNSFALPDKFQNQIVNIHKKFYPQLILKLNCLLWLTYGSQTSMCLRIIKMHVLGPDFEYSHSVVLPEGWAFAFLTLSMR